MYIACIGRATVCMHAKVLEITMTVTRQTFALTLDIPPCSRLLRAMLGITVTELGREFILVDTSEEWCLVSEMTVQIYFLAS